MSSTATPMWSMRLNTDRILDGWWRAVSGGGRRRLRRAGAGRWHVAAVQRRREAVGGGDRVVRTARRALEDVHAAPRRALHPRDVAHDPVDRVALEHLVCQQLGRELVELVAVRRQQRLGGAGGLVGELLLLLV